MDKKKVKLGIAPIAWTNDDMPDLGGGNTFEQCVSEMALAGFKGTELGNKYPADPRVRVYDAAGALLGTASVSERGVLSPVRLIAH